MAADSCDTRARLLEAAGEVFADRGFKAATVREIVERAGANLAAVNYHFGDKETLFGEVLMHLSCSTLERFPPDGGVPPEAPPEEQLRGYVRNFLNRCLGGGDQPEWYGRLMSREMANPSPILLTVMEQVMKPVAEHLAAIVRTLTGPIVSERDVWLCANSIIAQCVFYRQWDTVGERFHRGLLPSGPERIDLLAEHITRFSLTALREFQPEDPSR